MEFTPRRKDAKKCENALSREPSVKPHLLVRESFCVFVAFLAGPSSRLRVFA